VYFAGRWLSLWDSFGLGSFELRAGSIRQDARGRWYLNVCVRKAVCCLKAAAPQIVQGRVPSIGIDLGLKAFAAFSDPLVPPIQASRFYRDLEPALARAQRARKLQRVRALHARIANRRRDALHKLSTDLVNRYGAIFVGNVNACSLARTRMAKSVLDAGWSAFRTMLQYKCADAGVWFDPIDESFTTRTCSACNSRTGPWGREGLGIREWTCVACGSIHDRDTNAAQNILAAGHRRLAAGIPSL
jgi:IS605 OrfB family transposase